MQDQGVLYPPIFDKYSDEEDQIPFVDLRSSQLVYDNYESNCAEEQYCEEISHPESTEDIKQPSLQISEPAYTILELGSTDNSRQSIMNSKVSMQPCSDLQTTEDGSHDQREYMQRLLIFN